MTRIPDADVLRLDALRTRCRTLDAQLSALYDEAAALLRPASDEERDELVDHVIDWACTLEGDNYSTDDLLRATRRGR